MTVTQPVTTNVVELCGGDDEAGDWRDGAACRGRTELFFPRRAERPQARARREARAAKLCYGCAARLVCRDFAREHREYGFWGGESEEERHLAGYTMAAPIGLRSRRSPPAGRPHDDHRR